MPNQNQNPPPIDSRDYVIKILSERCQLFEKNIRTLATEIARLNMLKNGSPKTEAGADALKKEKKPAAEKVIDINTKKKPDTNAKQAQKLLTAPKKPLVKSSESNKPAPADAADADGNVKDPKDE